MAKNETLVVNDADLRIVYEAAEAAYLADLLGTTCTEDPCPVCTALMNVQLLLAENE